MAPRYPQTILVSCEIPWNEKYELMEETFREQIRTTLENGFNHLYIFGTAGEGYAVTTSQFQHIIRVFKEETDHDGVYPMVGVIAMSTPQVVERISLAHDAGFRTFQICLPPWGELDDSEVISSDFTGLKNLPSLIDRSGLYNLTSLNCLNSQISSKTS